MSEIIQENKVKDVGNKEELLIEISELILSENQQRFNSGEEVYQFLKSLDINRDIDLTDIKYYINESTEIKVKASKLANLQMYLCHLIIEDSLFMNLLIKDNENSLTIKGDLIDVAKNVLEKTEKFCKKLKSSIYPLISHKTDEYDEDRYIARSIDIDKNNRFVYRVNLDNNTIEILEVMFHNNRELLKESITQQIMMKMLYDIYKSKERIKFINYIYKIFDKLKLEEKPPSMEIRKIIPNKNPRRFNSGKELYDFIDKISINIKEIKRFMNNH